MTEGEELIPAYVASLPGRIAGAVGEAQRRLRPARVGAGSGRADIVVNRRLKLPNGRVVCGRHHDGFADREVQVLRLDDADERPIAVVVGYACHPTILGPPNRVVTPDYPGVVRRVVEDATGAPCLFLRGAAGSVHALVNYVGDPAVDRRLGAILGHEAARVALGLATVPRRRTWTPRPGGSPRAWPSSGGARTRRRSRPRSGGPGGRGGSRTRPRRTTAGAR